MRLLIIAIIVIAGLASSAIAQLYSPGAGGGGSGDASLTSNQTFTGLNNFSNLLGITIQSPAVPNSKFSLLPSPTGLTGQPVPALYPNNAVADMNIAFDVIPKGNPGDTGYGVAWTDVCNADYVANILVPGVCLHLGAGNSAGVPTSAMVVASMRLNAAAYLPLWFGLFDGDVGGTTGMIGSHQVNIDAGQFQELNGVIRQRRAITASGAITVAKTDHWIMVNKSVAAATTVNLFASPLAGSEICVKDAKGDAGANNITIVPNSGTIDGAANLVINANYGKNCVIANSSGWNVSQ